MVSPDGEVLGVADRISVTASGNLSTDAAAAIRSVFQKSGQVRVEMHDKQSALLALAKHLKLFDEPPVPPAITVNQLNVGKMDALEVARRVAFVLAAAQAGVPRKDAERLTIKGEPFRTQELGWPNRVV